MHKKIILIAIIMLLLLPSATFAGISPITEVKTSEWTIILNNEVFKGGKVLYQGANYVEMRPYMELLNLGDIGAPNLDNGETYSQYLNIFNSISKDSFFFDSSTKILHLRKNNITRQFNGTGAPDAINYNGRIYVHLRSLPHDGEIITNNNTKTAYVNSTPGYNKYTPITSTDNPYSYRGIIKKDNRVSHSIDKSASKVIGDAIYFTIPAIETAFNLTRNNANNLSRGNYDTEESTIFIAGSSVNNEYWEADNVYIKQAGKEFIIPFDLKNEANGELFYIKDEYEYLQIDALPFWEITNIDKEQATVTIEHTSNKVLGNPHIKDEYKTTRVFECTDDNSLYNHWPWTSPNAMADKIYESKPAVNTHNELLYYGGLASGIDPFILKSLLWKESSGNLEIGYSKENTNGTKDMGAFQINTHWLGEGKGPFGSTLDEAKLLRDPKYNLWAASEVVKAKQLSVGDLMTEFNSNFSNGDAESAISNEHKKTVAELFMRYNGVSEAGYAYGIELYNLYNDARNIYNKNLNKQQASSDLIKMGSISYDEFLNNFECVAQGKFEDLMQQYDERNFKDFLIDYETMDKATGIEGKKSQYDRMKDYYEFKVSERWIMIIFHLLRVVAMMTTVLIVFLWSFLIAYKLLPYELLGILDGINFTKIDFLAEDALNKVVYATIIMMIYIILTAFGALPMFVLKVIEISSSAIQNLLGSYL